MSLPPQINPDKSGKHHAAAMKEPVQHSGEVYYGLGPPSLESSQSDSAGSSGVYNPEKAPQVLPPYQQVAPVKWLHQDSLQAPTGWSQEAPVPAWGQNFGPYMGGVNARNQMAFHKGAHNPLPMAGENQLQRPVEVYRDNTRVPAQGRGLEWEQHAAAAMHQAQLQAYQHGHKGVELQGPPHNVQGSMLQPFQTTFSKQQFSSGYYPVFPSNKGMQSLSYGEQPKTQQQQQQQLLHQMQQQQLQQQQLQQQQQQQQLQLQQQLQQQQQMQQMQQLQQQQYHQQQLQDRQQQMQKMQQAQNISKQEIQPTNFITSQAPEPCPPDKKNAAPSLEGPLREIVPVPEQYLEMVSMNPAEPADTTPAAPRRSRRLSRDGQSPLAPPSAANMWTQAPKEASQNGVAGVQAAARGADGGQVATGGVIQSTRRRRRASKEINLETLAQKASEMPSLPESLSALKTEQGDGPRGNMVPLVIPVSVPVHRSQTSLQGASMHGQVGQMERPAVPSDCKPSVIVARRRSLRNSVTESFEQDGENDPGVDEEGKTKQKRRPRPEPLIIPPPRPSTFIPASVYSSITAYQSNLRSPVRLLDNPLALPPYTPPPILSPLREGSGLYFSTFLTNFAVSNQILPPPVTPKTANRSLLRSTSSDITPPVLPLITDATPVSLEPRINIGQQYQADIPELQHEHSAQLDQHKADLVWLPLGDTQLQHTEADSVENLMNMACSSVISGGGTNQELALHCLHESGGSFLETLGRLLLQEPIFPKGHQLAGYHYSGSDSWSVEEKHYFNKGISAYRKDFFLVQKLVQTKTVAQCVEFYYTYKKQVKIARNGMLTFGPSHSPVDKYTEAVVDIKSSQQLKPTQVEEKKEMSYDQDRNQQAMVAQSLQAHDYAGSVLALREPENAIKEVAYSSMPPQRPRTDVAAKKSKVPVKPTQDPDAVFPCKKCGRVFNKVKSRSAHMKSHAEQEKKAAALRQRVAEEQAAAAARARKEAALAATAASHQDGTENQAEMSSQDDSTEGEDDNDEDWH